MSRIPQSFLDELLSRVDLIELINKRVPLKKAGSDYMARCPFHNEKTPSFTVSPAKQFYHCFGCTEHGNAIGFLMRFDNMEFIDAVETLANHAGLTIPRDAQKGYHPELKNLYTLMEKAAAFYQHTLKRTPNAQTYLKNRGLSSDIINHFALGFSPPGWHSLEQHFPQNAALRKQLLTTGLLIQKPNAPQSRPYDRFRERIMFPIHDTRGRIIGFGGRALGDDNPPKYLNSPETPLFHKGQELYGLYQARRANRKLNKILIVEGYMDVIALAQHDISWAVATLGTATSARHIQRLFQATSDIIFCFDGDNAGQQAAWRALESTLPLMRDGLQANFMFLPAGEDPDSLIRKEGAERFNARLDQATPLADFLFEQLTQETDINTVAGRARLAQTISPLLNKMPNGVYQQLLFERLASTIHIEIEQLKTITQQKTATPTQSTPTSPDVTLSQRPSPLKTAITLLLQHPHLAAELDNTRTNTLKNSTTPGVKLLHQLINHLKTHPNLTTGALLEHWRDKPKTASALARLAASQHPIPLEGLKDELQDALTRIHQKETEHTIQALLTRAKNTPLSEQEKKHLQALIIEKQSGIQRETLD